ncbi:mitochondrial ribosomal subunit S27-domain-containing protein, partial [Aspergillus fumigatus]
RKPPSFAHRAPELTNQKVSFSTKMAASCSRILELAKTQCRIFSLNFNPQRLRLGNKVLRQRLRGPALAAWYPRKTVSFRDLQDAYRPLGLTVFDEYEDDREEAIQIAKLRGKGRPKKKRTAAGMIPIPVQRLLLTSIQNHDRRRRRNRQDHTGV